MQLKLRNTLTRTISVWNLNLGAYPFLAPYKPFSKRVKRSAAARINTSELAPSSRSQPQLKPKVQSAPKPEKPIHQAILHNTKQPFKNSPLTPESVQKMKMKQPSPLFSAGERMNTSRFPGPRLKYTP